MVTFKVFLSEVSAIKNMVLHVYVTILLKGFMYILKDDISQVSVYINTIVSI